VGLGRELSKFLLSVIPLSPGATLSNYLALVGLTSSLSVAATANGAPALFTPMAREISASTGFDLTTVIMVQSSDSRRCFYTVAVISVVVVVPLNFLWWKLLGQF